VQTAENVIYCCFDSDYSEPLRSLLEGVLREVFDLKQQVRMTDDGQTDAGVWVSLRQDYKTPAVRYLLVINTHVRNRTVQLELPSDWQFEKELLNNLAPVEESPAGPTFRLSGEEAYLIRLKRLVRQ
jgi:hypothetical protein